MTDELVLNTYKKLTDSQKYTLGRLKRKVGASSLEYIEELLIDVEKAFEISELVINKLSNMALDINDLTLIILALGIGVNKRSAADLSLLEEYPYTKQYLQDEINTAVYWYKDDLDEIYDVVMQTLNMKEAQSEEIMSLGI